MIGRHIFSIAALALVSSCGAPAQPRALAAPLTRAETGHLVAPVTVNGQGPFSFVVDTGAEGCGVYAAFAAAQGLPETGATSLQGQTGATDVRLTRVDSLVLAGREAAVECVVAPDRADGVALDGIVGLDSMGGYVVVFDAPNSALTLHAPGADLGPLTAPERAVAATRLPSGLFALEVRVNGVRGLGVLDTGARRTIINTRFATAAGVDAERFDQTGALYGATATQTELRIGPIGEVEAAGQRVAAMTAAVADLPVFAVFGVADQPAMILGSDVLGGYVLVVDFPGQRVWLHQP